MAHHMDEAPSGVRNGFVAFYNDIRAMNYSSFVKNLDQGHYLFPLIEQLQKGVIVAANETNWRGPSSTSAYTDFGPSPRSSYDGSRNGRPTYRPTTPNVNTTGGLHPNMYGQTPPRSPSSDRASNRSSDSHVSALSAKISVYEKKFEQNQNDLRSLRQQLDDTRTVLGCSQQDLASAHKTVYEQDSKIAGTRKAIEELHSEAASLYSQSNKYNDAARHFQKMAVLKMDEAQALERAGNGEATALAVNVSLVYEGRRGQMLQLDRQYAEAEDVFRGILKARRDRYGSDHLSKHRESRDTQLHLCQALRKQRLDHKTQEAEAFYRKHAILTQLEQKNDVGREWAVRNAVGLVGALVEQRDYRHAMPQLQDIWEVRSKLPQGYNRELDGEILAIVGTLERRMEPKPLIEALKILCLEKPRTASTHFLPCYTKLGKLLHENGASTDAIIYIQDALDNMDHLSDDDRRNALWTFALVQASNNKWEDVKTSLDDLNQLEHGIGSEPSKDMIAVLTARAQLNAGQFFDAENTALPLWEKYGVLNVLGSSPSLHQVDTLIKSVSKQKNKEKYTWVRDSVWGEVYNSAKKGDLTKQEIKMFAATGRILADDWEKARKGKVNNLTSPGKIREQCREMEALVGGDR